MQIGPAITPFAPLIALVCGFEKSGTTLLNEILRRHPLLDSGFECGFLLGNSPREFRNFQPYFAYFRQTWELSREDVRYICDTDDWSECYRRARERAPFIHNKNTYIFDKTPIYMLHLASVMAKVPGIPCVVNVRDPRTLMLSWANWSGFKDDPEKWLTENFEANCERYLSYANGYYNAVDAGYGPILLNRFETMCLRPEEQLTKIFNHFGLDFDASFLRFSSKHFVYGNNVSKKYLRPYEGRLSKSLCDRILAATSNFSDWHFTENP